MAFFKMILFIILIKAKPIEVFSQNYILPRDPYSDVFGYNIEMKKNKVKQKLYSDSSKNTFYVNYDKDGYSIMGDPSKWKTIIKNDTIIKLGFWKNKLITKYKFSFKKGLLTSQSHCVDDSNGQNFSCNAYLFNYNTQGYLSKIEEIESAYHVPPLTSSFEINNNTLLVSRINYITYDTLKHIITDTLMRVTYGPLWVKTYKYDNHGRVITYSLELIDTINIRTDPIILETTLENKYEKGKILITMRTLQRNSKGEIKTDVTLYEIFLYPNNLPKIEYIITNENKRKMVRSYTYTYH